MHGGMPPANMEALVTAVHPETKVTVVDDHDTKQQGDNKMSANDCERRGCSNVLCGLFSDEFGYLCNGCYDELAVMTKPTRRDIYNFLASEKEEVSLDAVLELSDTYTMT